MSTKQTWKVLATCYARHEWQADYTAESYRRAGRFGESARKAIRTEFTPSHCPTCGHPVFRALPVKVEEISQ
jgi:hypothetical protein